MTENQECCEVCKATLARQSVPLGTGLAVCNIDLDCMIVWNLERAPTNNVIEHNTTEIDLRCHESMPEEDAMPVAV